MVCGAGLLLAGIVAAPAASAQPTKGEPSATNSSATELTIGPPGPKFGAGLRSERMNLGPTMDVAVADGFVFAIGRGELRVLSNARDGQPVLLARLGGLGNTRQIAVSRRHAFITAREDGLFVVDVREPSRPRLVHHYDTIELATGIAISGDVAAVANRFAGVELIDVSRPAAPRYLSTVRVGEAQSVVFKGSWLYAGTWSEKAVAVIDVRDPEQPRLVKTVPLDGYGDGVDVSGNLLAAATGHHARSKSPPKTGDAAWGHGHGVEFFDLSDPAAPRRVSGLKFPPFYRLIVDTWGVVLAGGHALVNDAHNGFFLVDVREPMTPRVAGHRQLPEGAGTQEPSPATGVAVADGRAFVAGAQDDLHLVETGLVLAPPAVSSDLLRAPPPSAPPASPLPAYRVDGAIRSVLPWRDNLLLVAAGSAGLHVVRLTAGGFERMAEYPTGGFARDVAVDGSTVFVAESLGGLSIWKAQGDGSLKRAAAYMVPGKSIHQIVLADEGRVGFLAVGAKTLQVVRFQPSGQVELILEHTPESGLFYRDPISPLASEGQRLLVQWHTTGLHEYVTENGRVKLTGYQFPHAMGTECGATPWRDAWVATSRAGFFFLRSDEIRPPGEIGLQRLDKRALPGKPRCFGDKLLIADPFLGDVTAVDLSDEKHPRLMGKLLLNGHPGPVRLCGKMALIPAGREGLLLWDFRADGH
jgi:hypothetical protein